MRNINHVVCNNNFLVLSSFNTININNLFIYVNKLLDNNLFILKFIKLENKNWCGYSCLVIFINEKAMRSFFSILVKYNEDTSNLVLKQFGILFIKNNNCLVSLDNKNKINYAYFLSKLLDSSLLNLFFLLNTYMYAINCFFKNVQLNSFMLNYDIYIY